MVDSAAPPRSGGGRGRLLVAVAVGVAFLAGGGAGLYAGGFLGAKTGQTVEETDGETAPVEKTGERLELDVGRITVIIPSDKARGGNIHLLISPIVVGQASDAVPVPAEGADKSAEPTGPVPELRDAFIEYLSQLHEVDVRGSLGIMTIRAELLRRAQAVAPELNASAVLIQEFLIQ